jgi:hypothetical protein
MAEAIDQFAHVNPAFGLVCLRWICQGYVQQTLVLSKGSRGLLWPWGILGLSLLAPEAVRQKLPLNANGKLSVLFHENPQWRLDLAGTMKFWAAPFWMAMRLGVATGTLSMQEGRLLSAGEVENPVRPRDIDLKKRATALGKVLAKEPDDNAIALIVGLVVGP